MRIGCHVKQNLLIAALLVLGVISLLTGKAVFAGNTGAGKITAYSENITMSVDYGYDHYAKYGRYMNVSAVLVNEGGLFNGWLQIIAPRSEKDVVYRTEVSLSPGTSRKITVAIPLTDDSGLLQAKLVDGKQNTIVETNSKIKIGNLINQAYIGVLTENSKNLEYLDSFSTKAFYLDEDNLPSDYLGLDILDILVIDHFDTNRLSDGQLKAIKEWVKRGGSLVIGTGEYSDETLARLREDYDIFESDKSGPKVFNLRMDEDLILQVKKYITDYSEQRKLMLEIIKNRNDMLIAYGRQPVETESISPDQWAEECIGSLKPDSVNKKAARVRLSGGTSRNFSEGNRMVQTRSLGRGMIQLFSFDLSLEPENSLGYAVLLSIMDNLSDFKREQLQEEYYGAYSEYPIYDSLAYSDAKNIPNVRTYIVIIAIYLILIGPATFLVLRKYDKRSYTWVTVPVLALIFLAVVYLVGSNTRISRPYIGYVNILSYQSDNTVEDEVYFSLTSPNNHSYDVGIDSKYAVKELSSSSYSYMGNVSGKIGMNPADYMTAINYGSSRTALEVNRNPAFSPIYYQTKHTEPYTSALNCDLRYLGGNITGTVTNSLDSDLSDAILMCDGYLIWLGDIAQGQTVTVDGRKSIFLTSKDIYYNNDIINNAAGADGTEKKTNDTDRKLNTLYYIGENRLLDGWDSNYIVAFSDGNKTGMQNFPLNAMVDGLSREADCYGLNVVMAAVTPDYSAYGRVFVPSIDAYMDVEDNFYDSYYSRRYLIGESMTVVYQFPDQEQIDSFVLLPGRNQDFDSKYQRNFEGSIYFLNNKTGEFEEVFQSGVGSSVTDLTDYLSGRNTLTVQYSADVSLQTYQMLLPYISYWKEAGNVAENQ